MSEKVSAKRERRKREGARPADGAGLPYISTGCVCLFLFFLATGYYCLSEKVLECIIGLVVRKRASERVSERVSE